MANIKITKEITTHENADGEITISSVMTEEKRMYESEPNFLKLMDEWYSANTIPVRYRLFFLELAHRMSPCINNDLEHSQIVHVMEPYTTELCTRMGWKSKDNITKAMKALTLCNAVHHIGRGVYQINPHYAIIGGWGNNTKNQYSNARGFTAYYDSIANNGPHKIIAWADSDKNDNELDVAYREGLPGPNVSYIQEEYNPFLG